MRIGEIGWAGLITYTVRIVKREAGLIKQVRKETDKLSRFSKFGLVLRTDSGHLWFLDIDKARAASLVGLRVEIEGRKMTPPLRGAALDPRLRGGDEMRWGDEPGMVNPREQSLLRFASPWQ